MNEDRFWKKVFKPIGEGCWTWNGSVNSSGYGTFNVSGLTEMAHRVSWKIKNGLIPFRKQILHKCDNRLCVNPDHLFVGTQSQNRIDCLSKNRANFISLNDHKTSKLTYDAADEIRELSKITKQVDLSRKFGVSNSVISNIVNNKSWIRRN